MPRDYSRLPEQNDPLNNELKWFFESYSHLIPELRKYLVFQVNFSSSKPTIVDPDVAIAVTQRSTLGESYTSIRNVLGITNPNSQLLGTKKFVLRGARCVLYMLGRIDAGIGISSEDKVIIERYLCYQNIRELIILLSPRSKVLIDRNPHYRLVLSKLSVGIHPRTLITSDPFNMPESKQLLNLTQNLSAAFLNLFARGEYINRNGRDFARLLVFSKYQRTGRGWYNQNISPYYLMQKVVAGGNPLGDSSHARHLYELIHRIQLYDHILSGGDELLNSQDEEGYANALSKRWYVLPVTLQAIIDNDLNLQSLQFVANKIAQVTKHKPETISLQLSAGRNFLEELMLSQDGEARYRDEYIDRAEDIDTIAGELVDNFRILYGRES